MIDVCRPGTIHTNRETGFAPIHGPWIPLACIYMYLDVREWTRELETQKRRNEMRGTGISFHLSQNVPPAPTCCYSIIRLPSDAFPRANDTLRSSPRESPAASSLESWGEYVEHVHVTMTNVRIVVHTMHTTHMTRCIHIHLHCTSGNHIGRITKNTVQSATIQNADVGCLPTTRRQISRRLEALLTHSILCYLC